MIRKAFMMHVHPGQHEEYATRHQPIWPELAQTLKEHGVHTYSIFLNAPLNQLFAYVEFASEEQWQAIANTGICRKWWEYMSPIMPSNADHSPISVEIPEVFHLS